MSSVSSGSSSRSVWLGVASLCMVQFVDLLGVTVVVTALPDMLVDLGAASSAGSLVATGYAMFFGGLLMLGARCGDRFGHRRTILISLGVFGVGAVVGATAESVAVLTAARCLQGAAAAASVPSALRLLTTVTADGAQRQKAIAVERSRRGGGCQRLRGRWCGHGSGELRAVFFAYLPLAAALAVLIGRSVPRDRDADALISLNPGWLGLFTGAVMAFVVGSALLSESGPGRGQVGAVLLVASGLLAGVFVAVDRHARAPLLPRALLWVPQLRHGTLGAALNTLTTSSVITLTTLYLQNTLHRSPLAAAAMLVPFSLAVIAGSTLAAAILRRWRRQRVVAAGLTIIATADLTLIWAAPSPWALPICIAAAGAGIGLSSGAATGLGTDVESAWRGTASGLSTRSAGGQRVRDRGTATDRRRHGASRGPAPPSRRRVGTRRSARHRWRRNLHGMGAATIPHRQPAPGAESPPTRT